MWILIHDYWWVDLVTVWRIVTIFVFCAWYLVALYLQLRKISKIKSESAKLWKFVEEFSSEVH